jgi:hypothetical protein
MLVRAVSQAIEGSDAVSDTIWFTDTETACDALFRASDEIIDVADGLPNATDQRPGASPGPLRPLVGRQSEDA